MTTALRVTLAGLLCWFLLPAAGISFAQQDDGSIAELGKLEQELEALLSKYREAHPKVVAARSRIEELRKSRSVPYPFSDQDVQDLDSLKDRLRILLRRYTERHPEVVELRARIAALERSLPRPATVLSGSKPQVPANTPFEMRAPEPPAAQATRRPADFSRDGFLRLPITVKDVVGLGADGWPVSAVIPLPYGRYQKVSDFRLMGSDDSSVLAHFSVLDRWWAKDRSIRHLKVDFQPTVEPYLETNESTGKAIYYLRDDGAAGGGDGGVSVVDREGRIDVVTGPLRFTVNKRSFNILDQVWLDRNADGEFADGELVVQADENNGAVLSRRPNGERLWDSQRQDVTVRIEESGPLRVVIRAEAPTKTEGAAGHLHGFAVRIYAYAGKPYVKIDYQLQNSDRQPTYAEPLYFDSLDLQFKLRAQGNPDIRIGTGDGRILKRKRGEGLQLAQELHDVFSVREAGETERLASGKVADGFIDLGDEDGGAAAFVRFFSET